MDKLLLFQKNWIKKKSFCKYFSVVLTEKLFKIFLPFNIVLLIYINDFVQNIIIDKFICVCNYQLSKVTKFPNDLKII